MKIWNRPKILLGYIKREQFPLWTIIIVLLLYVVSFFYYKRSANRIEEYFYTQFREKVKSSLYSMETNLNEKVNTLIYNSLGNLTPLPQKATALNYIALKTQEILRECQFVNRILFLDFKNRKCTRIYPDEKVLNIPREIVSFKGLNLSRDKDTKNLFYLYVPNTKKEVLDSLIWGLVVIPIKVKRKAGKEVTVGEVFFLFNVTEMLNDFISEKDLAPGYKFTLVKKGMVLPENELTRYSEWDNVDLKISFNESSLTESSWRRYASSTKRRLFLLLLALWMGLLLITAIIILLYDRTKKLEREMYEKEKEDKMNMEAMAKLMSDTASSQTTGSGFTDSLITALETITRSHKGVSFAIYDKKNKEILHKYIGEEAVDVDFDRLKVSPEEKVLITTDVQISREEVYQIMFYDKAMKQDEDRRKYYESVLRIIDLGAEALAQRNLRQGMELKMFKTILKLLGSKDHYTCNHSLSMAEIAAFIAGNLVKEKYGFSDRDVLAVKYAGFLHDIGKMGIPDEILNKQGKYFPEEMAIMYKHPLFTEIMLEPLADISDFYDMVLNIAIRHHERGDGSGYPYGIIRRPEDPSKQREYLDNCYNMYRNDPGRQKRVCVFFEPIMQILAVSDVLDATLRDRPYKSALSDDSIIKILLDMKEKGQIDAYIIDATIKNFQSIKSIRPDDREGDCESFPSLPFKIVEKFLFEGDGKKGKHR